MPACGHCGLPFSIGSLLLLVSCILRGQDWIAHCGIDVKSTTTIHAINTFKGEKYKKRFTEENRLGTVLWTED